MTAIAASSRRAFVQGEAIPLHIVRRYAPPAAGAAPETAQPVHLTLEAEGTTIASAEVTVDKDTALEVPAEVTRRLTPGTYLLRPQGDAHESYALTINIAPAEADSPLQRVVYHEMGNASAANERQLPDTAEKLAYMEDWGKAMGRLHVTRETNRVMGASSWRHDWAPAGVSEPGYAPAEPRPGARAVSLRPIRRLRTDLPRLPGSDGVGCA